MLRRSKCRGMSGSLFDVLSYVRIGDSHAGLLCISQIPVVIPRFVLRFVLQLHVVLPQEAKLL